MQVMSGHGMVIKNVRTSPFKCYSEDLTNKNYNPNKHRSSHTSVSCIYSFNNYYTDSTVAIIYSRQYPRNQPWVSIRR